MSIVIEKGIPIPPQRAKDGSLRAEMAKMEIGDSFVYKNRGHAFMAAKRFGFKIQTRALPDGTYRIWRIA